MADEQQLRDYLRRVTIELAEERRRSHSSRHEPIAIVGMACRFPGGASDPEELWRLVSEEREGLADFPTDRDWDLEYLLGSGPDRPGISSVREAGFVAGASEFDAGFFGIGPKEATGMDPQQRLLLEVGWEALEDAGIVPASLHGSDTGVFVGLIHEGYGAQMLGSSADIAELLELGTSSSIASGRISYSLGLEGPAVTIDTACSSSLVALHLAGQALRSEECSLALVGGATVLSTPRAFVETSRLGIIAADGRCKAFADAADAANWSEGVGVLVVERLADAQRNGHPILATVRGSAVNQDGASNGLTAPNGPSQEQVVRKALASARLTPQEVDVVEAHGTGTTLGDPIEAGALLATYGQDREKPLRLGSIKSNIGHTQAAAGIAGVIKMVMAMREGVMPKTLHVDRPSTKIEWEAGSVELLTERTAWEPGERPRRAGVSSFGMSGTNAHAILEEAPEAGPDEAGGEEAERVETPVPDQPLPGPIPLVLSAKSEPALRESASRLAAHLQESPDLEMTDVAYSLATTRSSFERRAAVVGGDREEVLAALSTLAAGGESPCLVSGIARTDRKPVFLFPGHGSQWQGMALGLLDASPRFARKMRECEEALVPYLDWSFERALRGEDPMPPERVDIVQPLLFATMVCLADLWRAAGVEPAAVVGQSQGEIAAAHVAGGLSLEDAARIIALRSKMLLELGGGGKMISVGLSAEQVASRLEPWEGRIEVGAITGPASVVLSGAVDALDELISELTGEGVRAKDILGAVRASHSAHVEVLREEVLEAFAPLSPRSGEVPFHSTVTGEVLDTAELDAAYWFRNTRDPVLLEPVLRRLLERGERAFVEIGPHPVLGLSVRETAEDALADPGEVAVLETLRRDEGDPERFMLSLAGARTAGVEIEWEACFAGRGAKRVKLPSYPFQRKRYWIDSGVEGAGDVAAAGQSSVEHPLLAASVTLAAGEGVLLTGRIARATHAWLAGRTVFDTPLLPGAAFLELALEAGRQVNCATLEEFDVQSPLGLPESGGVALQIAVAGSDEEGRRRVSIHSRPDVSRDEVGPEEWTQHAEGTLSSRPVEHDSRLSELARGPWPPEGAEPVEIEDLYDELARAGLEYGTAFQSLRSAWRDGSELYLELTLSEEQAPGAAGFVLHPALLEPVFDAASGAGRDGSGQPGLTDVSLPSSWRGVQIVSAGASSLRVRVSSLGEATQSIAAVDQQGNPVVSFESARALPIARGELEIARRLSSLYRLEWIAAAPSSAGGDGPDVVIWDACSEPGDGDDLPASAHRLTARALERVQEWLSDEGPGEGRLVVLTHGAVAADAEEVPDLAAAPLWGLLRSAQAEHPGRFALIDADDSDASRDALPGALGATAVEPQIALREGKALVPRLARAGGGEDAREAAIEEIDPEATVLISDEGGMSFGGLVARHLAERHGARRLLLVRGSGFDPAAANGLEAELGAEVRIVDCDLTDGAQLAALLESIPDEHPLGAVIHTTVALDDGLIGSLSSERLALAMGPKVDAAWNLHELTRHLGLSRFLLFSSAASLLGAAGQGNYAAANSFLDALAAHRRAHGLPALSLAWGPWEASDDATEGGASLPTRSERVGLVPMSSAQSLELLDAAATVGEPLVVAAHLDRPGLRSLADDGMLPAPLRGLVRAPLAGADPAGALAKSLAAVSEAERESIVLGLVRSRLATVLGHDSADEVEPDRAFMELGLDSLGAVDLRNRLVAATGLNLPATLIFDHPSARSLARFLKAQAMDEGETVTVVEGTVASDGEPIAIVGMACRYPGGVASPDELWELVASEVDAISALPTDRGWDLARFGRNGGGEDSAPSGGFIDGVTEFDPSFFGISPREAVSMDPQQRLLLEASWEALEDAGLDPRSLRGSQTGVFVGVGISGYGINGQERSDQLGGLLLGMSPSVVSGRISYTLGLEGPAVSVDTACSSSLVAMHLAVQSLRSGESSLALAGGVLVLAVPPGAIDLNMPGGLAPDGRCKAFAEAADGTGFSEGTGALLLERLSDAERNGHPVLATIRGSAINQDGASNGLAAPNGPSQERVIRQALANARLAPRDVDAVDAHGTGTTLGDPIEAGALLAVYGQDRDEPLRLGSLKSNIGHTGPAAGVASVIKTVMAMRESALPKTLHVDAPSSKIDWGAGQVELLTEARQWQPNGHPRRAAVSSFGVSGTNAHLILEEAPGPRVDEDREQGGAQEPPLVGSIPLALSARSEPALCAQAARLAAHLRANPDLDPADVAYSLAMTRAAFERRAVALGSDREQLLETLDALAHGTETANAVCGEARDDRPPVFLFPGQGSQWKGMAAELIEGSPAFDRRLGECEEALSAHIEWSVRDVLTGADGAPPIERIEVVQPVLFAVMVSLAELWRVCGVVPAAVAGHSQGEIAAAHVAGGLSLEEAAMLAAVRSRIISRLAGEGAMVSVALPAKQVQSRLTRWQGRIEIAAQNGPSSTVLSAEREALDEFLRQCAEEDVRAREVPATIPSHSARVEPLREEVLEAFALLSPRSGEVPFHSTVTGEVLDTAELGAEYWYRNLREPVRFEQVTRNLLGRGHRVFVEVSPHPVFALALRETVEDAISDPGEAAVLGTLRRDEGGPQRFALSLGEAHVNGAALEWATFFEGTDAKRVPLPTYPFQRGRYWLSSSAPAGNVSAAGLRDPDHPLLGAAIDSPEDGSLQLTGRISPPGQGWMTDYEVFGVPVLPGAALVDLAFAAGREVGAGTVEELKQAEPLVLPESGAVQLRISVGAPDDAGNRKLAFHSRIEEEPGGIEGEAWTRIADGILSATTGELDPKLGELGASQWPPEGAEALGAGSAWQRGDELFAELSPDSDQAAEAGHFAIHPALLAAAEQLGGGDDAEPFREWHGLRLHLAGAGGLRVRIALDGSCPALIAVDGAGVPVLSIESMERRPFEPGQLREARNRRSLYRVEWSEPGLAPAGGPAPGIAVLGTREMPAAGGGHYPDLPALLEGVRSGDPAPQVVLVDGRQTGERLPGAAHETAGRALELLGGWLSAGELEQSRLVFVTEGALAVAEEELRDLPAAPLWGILRSAHSEHPGRFGVVDVDDLEASWAALEKALEIGEEEPQVAIRDGKLLLPRLARARAGGGSREGAIDPATTVLITDGTSAVGALLARHLVTAHGTRHLLLAGREGYEGDAAAEIRSGLEALGAEVAIAQCDTADRAQLEGLLESVDAEHPLGAVIHTECALGDRAIETPDLERLERVMRPKMDAAWHLHELTARLDLSQFLLLSSPVGMLGNVAQAHYAASAAFLDALAVYRRAQGFPAASIPIGGWLLDGAAPSDADGGDRRRLERLGLTPLTEERYVELFDAGRASGEERLVPVDLNVTALRSQAEAGVLPAILRDLVRLPAGRGSSRASLRDRLVKGSTEERHAILLDLVRSHVAVVLGHESAEDVEPDRVFQEMGFDSVGIVELRNRVEVSTGLPLPMLALIDHPTSRGISDYLLGQLPDVASTPASTSLTIMLGKAREQGDLDDFIDLVAAASKFRTTFEGPADLEALPEPVRLAEGDASPSLVLVCSVGPLSGPQEYAKLASAFRGERDVLALPVPGFVAGEPVAAGVDALSAAFAEVLQRSDLDRGFALAGHSSGGWIAHALARHLEAVDAAPGAVILLDTYKPQARILKRLIPKLLDGWDGSLGVDIDIDDTRLTAMGSYLRLFSSWTADELAVPTVMVRAGDPAWSSSETGGEWQASWDAAHRTVDVPGDHFTMMTDHAHGTARTVQQALTELQKRQTHAGT